MRYKKYLLGGMMFGTMIAVTVLSGCESGKTEKAEKTETVSQKNLVTIEEARKQAENFESEYKNLDFSEAQIKIPDVQQVYEMEFPISTDSFDRQVEKFEENIRLYEGLDDTVDLKQHMTLMYWDVPQNDRLIIPILEATDEQKEQVQYLGYNDGTCSELVIFSTFMLELGDYSVPTALTGEEEDYTNRPYGYRGMNLGHSVQKYDLSKDDITGISYPLSDGELALTDAVQFVEQHMKEDYYFVGSEYLDYHVLQIDVRQLSDEIYYYEFDMGTSYEGLALNYDDATEVEKEGANDDDVLKPEAFGTNHFVSMFQKDRLGFIWSCCQNFESVSVKETYEKILPLQDVCELLSKYVSADKVFHISSVELEYQTKFQYENEKKRQLGYVESVQCRPSYHFSIKNTQLSEFSRLYFDVDAITGEITTMGF